MRIRAALETRSALENTHRNDASNATVASARRRRQRYTRTPKLQDVEHLACAARRFAKEGRHEPEQAQRGPAPRQKHALLIGGPNQTRARGSRRPKSGAHATLGVAYSCDPSGGLWIAFGSPPSGIPGLLGQQRAWGFSVCAGPAPRWGETARALSRGEFRTK